MKKASFYSTLIIVWVLSLTVIDAQAQFNGEIAYTYSDLKNKGEDVNMSLFITPTRIRVVASEGSVDASMVGIKNAGSILIRLDKEDFVVMEDGAKQAISVPKKQIEALVNMSSMMSKQRSGQSSKYAKVQFEYSGTREEVMGYNCEKVRVYQADEKDEVFIWVTDDLPVYWGMLVEKWNFMGEYADVSSFEWFKNGRLPLRVEWHQNGSLKSTLTAITVDEKEVEPALTNIPDGVKIISTQDMMLNQFRNSGN